MSRIFGAIRQNGYVVKDIEAAMRHWSEVMGVGPWFYNEAVPLLDFTYKGTPSAPVCSYAITGDPPGFVKQNLGNRKVLLLVLPSLRAEPIVDLRLTATKPPPRMISL